MPAGAPPAEQAQPPVDDADLEVDQDQSPSPEMEGPLDTSPPNTQELVRMWQSGDHMAVAARLMFTEASYADFVDLIFAIGQSAGRELGYLLDELADTEGIEPPSTPPQYQDMMTHIATAGQEDEVL